MTDVDAALRTQLRNIEATYGQPAQHWLDLIDSSGLSKHNQVVAMLKTDYGLAHGAAHRLSLLARDRAASAQSPAAGPGPDPVAGLYTGRKVSLLPLHDQLMAIIEALGAFDIVPKKGYLSLRRRKQFAMIQPSAAGRVDLGLVLPAGIPPDGRLEAAGKWNSLFTHRVRITDAADLDDHLRDWLSAAYEAAA